MQRLNGMPTSELIKTAHAYSGSIKEVGIYSELVKELTNRLDFSTTATSQALAERADLRREVTAYEATVTNLTAQVQGLAAENGALKATNDDRRTFIMNGVQLGYIKVPTVETDPALETIRIAVSPQEPTPATDAALAEMRNEARAEGINYAAGRLAAAFNHGHIDKPLAEVFDVTRMILTAKEDIANEPAADGLSGEYAETALKEWDEKLRKEQGK